MNLLRTFSTAAVGMVLPFSALLAEEVIDAPGAGYRQQLQQMSPPPEVSAFVQENVKQTTLGALHLEKDYSLSLKPSALMAPPLLEDVPEIRPGPRVIVPSINPDGLPLWKGARKLDFDGRPFYLIPL